MRSGVRSGAHFYAIHYPVIFLLAFKLSVLADSEGTLRFRFWRVNGNLLEHLDGILEVIKDINCNGKATFVNK